MAAPKRLVSRRVIVDVALKSHDCQHNASHRVTMGDRRLKVPKGRSFEHYCVECGLRILIAEIEHLKALESELRQEPGSC
jgi:hypothetical protein